jgi:glycosyltransferase involved in cell wall biosynthesis
MVRNLYIWLEKITGRISTKLVVVSYANADKGEKNGVFKRGDWILCRDAISVEQFMQPGSSRMQLAKWGIGDASGKVIVGMIACFKPQKSPVDFVDVAAEVLKQTPRVHFVMAGDGELRPQVEARIRQHGIEGKITLLGWMTESEMPELYRNLDIVVLTSLWEGLPCVFSEAMAGELPIVATNVDGAREAIVHEENGYLHEPHDIHGMAQSVLKLVESQELRKKMGARGKSRVMEFDIGTSVSNLEMAYQECLKIS